MWDAMFAEYKDLAHLSDEEVWKEVAKQYAKTHPIDKDTKKAAAEQGVELEEELPFKTIGELMDDYFKLDTNAVCSLDTEVPKYFYYRGQTFEIDFKALDLVHERVLEEKKKKEDLEVSEAVSLFHEMGLDHFNPTEEDLQRIRMLKTMEEQLQKKFEAEQREASKQLSSQVDWFGVKRLKNVITKLQDEDTIWEIVQYGPASLFNGDTKKEDKAGAKGVPLTENSGLATPITYGIRIGDNEEEDQTALIKKEKEELALVK